MKKLKDKKFLINIILYIITPLVITIVLESLGSRRIFGGVIKMFKDPYVFWCNMLIVASTLSIGALMGRFRRFWIGFVSVFWVMLGVINNVIIRNRVIPLTAYDLQLIDTLPFIIKRYLGPVSLAVICLVILMAMLVLVVLFAKCMTLAKEKRKIGFSLGFVATVIIVTCTSVEYGISAGALDVRFTELARDFVDNGFAYSFTTSIMDSGVDEVDGYSKELMTTIAGELGKGEQSEVKRPNIVFVQMESFFDLNSLKNVKFSKNPLPNFTKLTGENASGLLTVPVIGAGTANTEFEVTTGMKVSDFGAGEYPYKTVLVDKTCESTAYNLKPHGYQTHFIHNYKGSFYGRNRVYANLGYDNFYSLEYMTDYEVNESGWAKDKILTKYINECLDSTEGTDFVTTISVQGHGSYADKENYKRHLTVTECKDKSLRSSYEYYANQIYEMDSFIGELVTSLSERGEDTVLVLYGDHLPSLNIESADLKGRGIYQTDYVIWTNMDLDYRDENICAYQLSSKVLEALGISDGVINACHQQYGDDEDYLFNLQALEYDILYGEKYVYGGENPYVASKMKKNNRKIEIHTVEKKSKDVDTYVIKGEGFSEKSVVRISYKMVYSKFVDENTLEFTLNPADINKPISVWEREVGDSNRYFIE